MFNRQGFLEQNIIFNQTKKINNQQLTCVSEKLPPTKTICQLPFPYRQLTSQPATTALRLDRKQVRTRQLHIVPSVMGKHKKTVQK